MTSFDAAFSGAPVQPGDIIAGKYRVESVLGSGAMGVVVRALHLQLQAPVAIKFLLPQAAKSPGALERFLREARATIQIHSEHVARVLDVDMLDERLPYMVIEYLEGRNLADVLASGGALPREQAVTFILQACEALAEAHAAGITHRDLKPANLFLTQRHNGMPSVKVLDFGISKLRDGSGATSMTNAGALMGSPLYMSPEQFASAKDVDARSDIWSLGVILYELLSGAPPYHAENLPALCHKVITEPPPSLLERCPDLPPGLVGIVGRCLRRNREQRYATVGELASELGEFGPEWARSSVARVASAVPRKTTGVSAHRESDPTLNGLANTRAPTRRSWRWIAAAVALVALVGVAVIVVRASTDGDPPHALHPAAATSPSVGSGRALTAHGARPDVARRPEPVVSVVPVSSSAAVPTPPATRPQPSNAKAVPAKTVPAKTGLAKTVSAKTGPASRPSASVQSLVSAKPSEAEEAAHARRRSLEELAEDRR